MTKLNHHQNAIDTIQTIQTSDSAMLKTFTADNIDIKTSINHIIGSLSSLATKLNIQITLPQPLRLSPTPPTPPSIVAAAAVPTPLPIAATNSTALAPPLPQPPGPAAPFFHLLSLPSMAPSSPVKPYNSTHQILKSFSDSHIELLLGIPDTLHIMSRKQQLKIALNSFDKSKLVRTQIAIGCGTVFEQKYRKDETSPYIKMLGESKLLVFDPGGTLRVARVFDLEDKVGLKGMVMIWNNNRQQLIHAPITSARPKRNAVHRIPNYFM